MDRIRPDSSHIAELRYDAEAQVLEVEFAKTTPGPQTAFYRYQHVDGVLWHAIKAAKSVGHVFTTLIRNNPIKHPFTKHLINEPVTSEADTLEDVLKKSVKPLTARRPRITITKKD